MAHRASGVRPRRERNLGTPMSEAEREAQEERLEQQERRKDR
jgi:hypothetical protein